MGNTEFKQSNWHPLEMAAIGSISLPNAFTFPFYYDPHPLSIMAANDLQHHLENGKLNHNFGLDSNQTGLVIGKMFGVLVTKNEQDELGYLAAFSGKLADSNHHGGFVGPVFDILAEGSYYKKEEKNVSEINNQLEVALSDQDYLTAVDQLKVYINESELQKSEFRKMMKTKKRERDQQRADADTTNQVEYEKLISSLKSESIDIQQTYKRLVHQWSVKLDGAQKAVDSYEENIQTLKRTRKARSNALQHRLFEDYSFLNGCAEKASLLSIFDGQIPPAGAGECAAPKLLQYAYLNNLRPVCMAEFWWGASPASEVRKHKQYYPACKGKCEPILGHMLRGLEVDPDLIAIPPKDQDIPILYEDEAILVIDKPSEMLSVPGKLIKASVYSQIQEKYPQITGPIIIHRLDMSTSGLMVLAKDEKNYKYIQRQFIKRTIEKSYTAVLEGEYRGPKTGTITLPLRVDPYNRPFQVVCFELGKEAFTDYTISEISGGKTRIVFFPKTGRTHQLRVHAAHRDGLRLPIVGDDLYGQKGQRLHLHATTLSFVHPTTRERIKFESKVPF